MPHLVLLAYDDDMYFDKAYARAMRLPFNRGWEKWIVLEVHGRGQFTQRQEFTDFHEAEDYINEHQPTLH